MLPNSNEIIFLQSSLCFLFHVCAIITIQYKVSKYAITIFCVMICAQVNLSFLINYARKYRIWIVGMDIAGLT